MMDDVLFISKNDFSSPQVAEKFLVSLYKDKFPLFCGEDKLFYNYKMVWPANGGSYRDPFLEKNMKEYFNLSLANLPFYYKEERWNETLYFIESFHHHWTLLGWANWLQREKQNGEVVNPFIIHVDSHDDLQTPSLFFKNDNRTYSSLFDSPALDLDQPSTIKNYITRGFIGIGGFIAPFLHHIKNYELLHIYNDFEGEKRKHFEQRRIELIQREENYLGKKWICPSLKYHFTPPFNYTISSDQVFLSKESNCKILLDIDMDYFCNQFDNQHGGSVSKLEEDQVKEKINAFIHHLKFNFPREKVNVISMALSPNFYPSQFWNYFFYLKMKLQEIFG